MRERPLPPPDPPPPPVLERELAAAARDLDRRAFLRGVGGLAALGLLPAGSVACAEAPDGLGPPSGVSLRVLTPRTYAVLNTASLSLVGPPGAALVASGRVDPARNADTFLAASPALAAPLGQALLALEFGPWPLLRKLRPFTSLSRVDRDAILEQCMRSRWALTRRLFGGVRAVALLAFYAAPQARALARYPGAPGVAPVSVAEAMVWPEEP